MLTQFIIDVSDERNRIVQLELEKIGYKTTNFSDLSKINSSNNIYILSPRFDFLTLNLQSFKNNSKVFYYFMPEDIKVLLLERDIILIKITDIEQFTYHNCVFTAEGALMHSIMETDIALIEMKVLILGFGHLGKALARTYQPLSAGVTVATNQESELASAMLFNTTSITIDQANEDLSKYDLIINTIPAQIFNKPVEFAPNVLIIELATKIHPFDYEELDKKNIKSIILKSLPAKVCKLSAGKLLMNTILNQI